MNIKLHKPTNKEFELLVEEYNKLVTLNNEVSSLINEENKSFSNHTGTTDVSKKVNKKFSEYENFHEKWIGKAMSYHADQKNILIPPGQNQTLSAFHFLNVLSNMISSAEQMYNQARLNHSNLISNGRYRKTMWLTSVSMFLAILSIVLSLV